jgi:predicted TIM-barrel fold metal-dependent hydrolase
MSMPTIDAQVHAYERDHAARPWAATLAGPPEVTGDDMVTAMDAVGVDGAILVSPWTLYRYDESYALSVQAAYPGRFGLVKPIDPSDPAVAETIEDWAGRPGTVAIRIMLSQTASTDGNDPGIDNVLCAAARHGLPVNLSCKGRLEQVRQLASRNVETQLVVDHLGLEQPHHPPVPQNPFGELSKLLTLAQYDNIAVKVTGVCTLSHSLFPYDDLWDPLARVFDAFGLDRCMWGTDWTRAMEIINYAQGVEPFRLTDRLSSDERETLMGGTLQRIYDWSPRPNQ